MSIFEEWCSKIKVIVSEIDGIITEDLLYIDELGNVPFKGFYRKDFDAINELKKTFTFVFLSSDNAISYNMCRRKNIPFFHAPKNKKNVLIKVMQRYGVSPEEIIYIGNSYSDVKCLRMIPFSLCPSDAVEDVKSICYHKLSSCGGIGVLEEVFNLLKHEIIRRKTLDK